MFSLAAELDISAIERGFRALDHEIDDEMDGVFERTGDRLAQTAKAMHRWQNRTGNLEESIEGLPPSGTFLAGTLQGGVVAGMDYASYLEARPEFAYLRPAWNYIEPFFEQDCNRALDRAVSVAGFR